MLDDDDHVFCVEVVRRERKMFFLNDRTAVLKKNEEEVM